MMRWQKGVPLRALRTLPFIHSRLLRHNKDIDREHGDAEIESSERIALARSAEREALYARLQVEANW
jgi:hypothetical protein